MKTVLFLMLFGMGSQQEPIQTLRTEQSVKMSQETVLAAEVQLSSNHKWIKGSVYCLTQDSGQLVPIKFVFAGVANGKGEFAQNTEFTTVEKGSRLAVRKGFTHKVDVPGLGTAYVKVP
jgi:hypothetical protein